MIDDHNNPICELCSKESVTKFDEMYLCAPCLTAYVTKADKNRFSELSANSKLEDIDFVTRPTREILHLRVPQNDRKQTKTSTAH